MSILRHQADVSGPVPLPTDRVDDASTVTAVSGEALTWYYVTSSAWASATGQAAGTIVTGKLAFSGVLNSMKSAVGTYNDTSLSFAAATRAATKVSIPEDVLSQMVFMTPTEQSATAAKFLTTAGYYAIDHRRGQIWLKSKDTVANDSVSYSYMAPVVGSGGPTASVTLTNLEKAEDAAHTGTDKGLMALAVRNDAGTALAGTTGDYIPLTTDDLGSLRVNAGAMTDDAAFTAGTSKVTAVGMVADEATTDSVDEGDIGAPRMTLNRRQIMAGQVLDDAAFGVGTEYVQSVGMLADEAASDSVDEGDVGAPRMTLDRKQINSSEFKEDTAPADGDYGTHVLSVRKDTAASTAGTDGDYASLTTDATGKLWVNADVPSLADDAAFTVATSKVVPVGALADETATDSVDEGDVGAVRMTLDRRLQVKAGTALEGPGNPVIDSYATVAINLTTGANQVLVSSAADKQIWVYGYAFTVGDAAGQTVSLQDEDDTALTGIMEFAQYGGISVPPSGNFAMPVFKCATDKDLEIDITGGDVDGWLAYAIVSV